MNIYLVWQDGRRETTLREVEAVDSFTARKALAYALSISEEHAVSVTDCAARRISPPLQADENFFDHDHDQRVLNTHD